MAVPHHQPRDEGQEDNADGDIELHKEAIYAVAFLIPTPLGDRRTEGEWGKGVSVCVCVRERGR